MAEKVKGRSLLTALLALGLVLALAVPAGAAKRYRDQVFDKIKTRADLVYGSAPVDGVAQELDLDLYKPKGDRARKRPAIVWVHGGGFANGDKRSDSAAEFARSFAHKGYVTVSINYRLLVETGCSGASGIDPACYAAAIEAVHDAQAAVRWLRANAKGLRIDRKRIAIGGESAGAITSSGVGVLAADPGSSGNPGPSSEVGAFVSISGGLPGALFVDENSAPGILFASLGDPLVPYQWSVDTSAKLTSLGIPSKLVSYEGNDHVPLEEHGAEIEAKATRFIYRQLDLREAGS